MTTPKTNTAAKSTALDALRALGKKSSSTAAGAILPPGMADPAIVGAKKDKNTVKLGFDPAIAEAAKYAAELSAALKEAASNFEVSQSEMRDYGIEKRSLYNEVFKANVTTVCVPYSVQVGGGVHETRYVQVICSNRYSVNQEMALANRDALGDSFDRLFKVTDTKVLKPNAEDLIRGVLAEAGMAPDEVEVAMASLVETVTKVATTESYEQESAKVTDEVKVLLGQAVTRAQPSLKFPA